MIDGGLQLTTGGGEAVLHLTTLSVGTRGKETKTKTPSLRHSGGEEGGGGGEGGEGRGEERGEGRGGGGGEYLYMYILCSVPSLT